MSMQMSTLRRAIAIDFDGTICTNAFPDIGEPNWDIIEAALEEQRRGAGLILWTLREGEFLNRALDACKRWGLHFDAVNDSLPDWIAAWGNDPRKVAADEYWDDRAVGIRGSTFTRLKEMRLYDVIRVVRCYNCQFSKPPAVLTQKYGQPGTLTCHNFNSPCNRRNVNKYDFCSYAKRKGSKP